jgi:MFS family permease
MLTWRFIVGLGSGAAFVAGAGVAASLGKHSSLGQGMYGGSVQIGSALGLLLTPLLVSIIGWRGSFLFWGHLGIVMLITWMFVRTLTKPLRQKTYLWWQARDHLQSGHSGTHGNLWPWQRGGYMDSRLSRFSIRPTPGAGGYIRLNCAPICHDFPSIRGYINRSPYYWRYSPAASGNDPGVPGSRLAGPPPALPSSRHYRNDVYRHRSYHSLHFCFH